MKQEVTFEKQSIGLQGVANARELGGYIMADGRRIKRGRLLRSGTLHTATDADVALLESKYHLAHIFDYRTEYEKTHEPDRPVAGADNLFLSCLDPRDDEKQAPTFRLIFGERFPESLLEFAFTEEAQKLASVMYSGMVMSEWTQLQYATFLNYVLNTEEGAVLCHCSQGKDRTGMGIAYLLFALGADRDLVVADFDMSNIFYHDFIEELFQKIEERGGGESEKLVIRSFIGVNTPMFEKALDLVDREFGSMHDYIVNQLCVSEQELELLRSRYLE